MENGRSERCLRADVESLHHVVRRLAPPACDHRDVSDGLHHGAGELAVVPLAGAVAVPASQQNLAGAEADTLCRPPCGVLPGLVTAASHHNIVVHVAARLSLASVDGEDDTLTAQCLCQLSDKLGPLHRG